MYRERPSLNRDSVLTPPCEAKQVFRRSKVLVRCSKVLVHRSKVLIHRSKVLVHKHKVPGKYHAAYFCKPRRHAKKR